MCTGYGQYMERWYGKKLPAIRETATSIKTIHIFVLAAFLLALQSEQQLTIPIKE